MPQRLALLPSSTPPRLIKRGGQPEDSHAVAAANVRKWTLGLLDCYALQASGNECIAPAGSAYRALSLIVCGLSALSRLFAKHRNAQCFYASISSPPCVRSSVDGHPYSLERD